MDKIWVESRRSLAVVAGDEKTRMTAQNRQKSNVKKHKKTTTNKQTFIEDSFSMTFDIIEPTVC